MSRLPRIRAALLLLGLLVANVAYRRAFHEVAWPDECIYLVGAKNVIERLSLDTNYYLTSSVLLRGHPHRDVHMPGYVLALTPFVAVFGATLFAASCLNVMLFLACILLLHALARALLENEVHAATAAALFAILPPFPGYLHVAYPELLASFVFLAGLAWLFKGRGSWHAPIAGFLLGIGALVRETSLLALPIYLARLPRRELLRGLVPGLLAALLLVVVPLSSDRAVHPNAIYPSVFEEARRSPDPLATLADALLRNVASNLADASEARPLANAEDAVLASMLLLVVAGAVAGTRHASTRRVAWAAVASMALLGMAVLVLYVVRQRGGVWGGVRVFMSWMPLFLVFATPSLLRLPRLLRGLALAAVVALLLQLDAMQLYRFLRYKSSDHEDQSRHASYVASYVARGSPRRIVGRLFLYGLEHYPTEIVWSPPRDFAELQALQAKLAYDYVVINDRSPLRLFLIRNPRYVRVNRDDRGAELLIFRRLE